MKISVIITAAGKGKRFGQPKWLAESNGITFLERIINTLNKAGLKNIICVYRDGSKPEISGAEYVLNNNPDFGMLSSVYYGIINSKKSDGILIWPVDHPFVLAKTIKELIHDFKNYPDSVIKPSFSRKCGHPIIIPWTFVKKIDSYDVNGGLRKLISDYCVPVRYTEVEDKNVLKNINKIEDLS